jgi:hypothetical protein
MSQETRIRILTAPLGRARRRTGDRLAWAGPLVTGTFVAGVGGMMARSEHPYPRPGTSAEDIRAFFTQPARAAWIGVAGQTLSTASLAAWTLVVARLAGDDRALRRVAVSGGALATGALATSAVCSAALVAPGAGADRRLRLHRTAFVAGGPIHGAGFGLLLGALGLAGGRTSRLSRPLRSAALAAAGANLLAPGA